MPQSDIWQFIKNKNEENVECNGKTALILEKQLGHMEGEVKEIQMKLAAIKRDRVDIEMSQEQAESFSDILFLKEFNTNGTQKKHASENSNDTEIEKLRKELMIAINAAEEEKIRRKNYERKLKELELISNNVCVNKTKSELNESCNFSEEQITSLKNQIRDLKEETEELNVTILEKNDLIEEYCNKYLQAQQEVEELKRQVKTTELENNQVSNQMRTEIKKMKLQFQEKLQELAQLPNLLKMARLQIEESKQLQILAEDNAQQLNNELHKLKERLAFVINIHNNIEANRKTLDDEKNILKSSIVEKDKDIERMDIVISENKFELLRLQEKLCNYEALYDDKRKECMNLMENIKEQTFDSKKSLDQFKARADFLRTHLQSQVTELEKQLAQSRAQAKASQMERDEVRQQMLNQMENLQDNYEMVELNLGNIQRQIQTMKNCYSVVLEGDEIVDESNTEKGHLNL